MRLRCCAISAVQPGKRAARSSIRSVSGRPRLPSPSPLAAACSVSWMVASAPSDSTPGSTPSARASRDQELAADPPAVVLDQVEIGRRNAGRLGQRRLFHADQKPPVPDACSPSARRARCARQELAMVTSTTIFYRSRLQAFRWIFNGLTFALNAGSAVSIACDHRPLASARGSEKLTQRQDVSDRAAKRSA
jgi:hypothetical protein